MCHHCVFALTLHTHTKTQNTHTHTRAVCKCCVHGERTYLNPPCWPEIVPQAENRTPVLLRRSQPDWKRPIRLPGRRSLRSQVCLAERGEVFKLPCCSTSLNRTLKHTRAPLPPPGGSDGPHPAPCRPTSPYTQGPATPSDGEGTHRTA